MIGIFIALAVLLGVGGTVTVADNARPGDTLFEIDQAVEKLRLNIARKENKNELRIKFAEERVREIEDLAQDDDEVTSSPSAEEQINVKAGIEAALNLLARLEEQQGENSRLDDIIGRLNAFITDLPSDVRIKISDNELKIKFENDDSGEVEIKEKSKNGKSKIKIRTDEGRIKIEVENGVLEIKTKLDDNSDGLAEVEAEILPDKTIVRVEFNDEETTFTTSATTRETIITAIIAKFPSLTSAQVDAVLEIETEDENKDGNRDDDNDEDEDGNNSGSNSGSGSN